MSEPILLSAVVALVGNMLGVLGVWKRLGDLHERIKLLDAKLDAKADKDDVADIRARVLSIEDTCRVRGCKVSV